MAEDTDNRAKLSRDLLTPGVVELIGMLSAGGEDARVVGGAVRNALLDVPLDDIDIATTCVPEEATRRCEAAGFRVAPTGLRHGTVTVIAHGRPYEVTTLRRDVDTDGRHAEVVFSRSFAEDAARRDFTLNALYCAATGELSDPTGQGLADLRARRVRFIGAPEVRIAEDYLRVLRFFRFSARFGEGRLDPDGLKACIAAVNGLERLSAERISGELLKILAGPRAADTVEALRDAGILTFLLPVAPRLGVFRRLIDLEARAMPSAAPDADLRLAALTVAVEEDAGRLVDRLRLSRRQATVLADAGRTVTCVSGSAAAPDLLNSPAALRVALFRSGPEGYRREILLRAALTGGDDPLSSVAGALALPDRWTPPPFPVSGADVLAAGVPKGERVGAILADLERLWVASDFSATRSELLAKLDQLKSQSSPGA